MRQVSFLEQSRIGDPKQIEHFHGVLAAERLYHVFGGHLGEGCLRGKDHLKTGDGASGSQTAESLQLIKLLGQQTRKVNLFPRLQELAEVFQRAVVPGPGAVALFQGGVHGCKRRNRSGVTAGVAKTLCQLVVEGRKCCPDRVGREVGGHAAISIRLAGCLATCGPLTPRSLLGTFRGFRSFRELACLSACDTFLPSEI